MVGKYFYLFFAAILLGGCVSVHETKHITDDNPASVGAAICRKEPATFLRHVVLFKFKDSTTAEQIREIESAFCTLPSKIDAIYDFEWGTDVSVENRSEGFTHCFVVTFRHEADRDRYLPHPAHQEFVEILRQHLDKVLVIDYWAKN